MVSIIIAIAVGLPIAILKKMLSTRVLKPIGAFLSFGFFGLCMWMIIVNAAVMGVSESNEWGVSYIFSILIDIFGSQIIITFLKLKIFIRYIGESGIVAHWIRVAI